jgi:hypothetical protein
LLLVFLILGRLGALPAFLGRLFGKNLGGLSQYDAPANDHDQKPKAGNHFPDLHFSSSFSRLAGIFDGSTKSGTRSSPNRSRESDKAM